MSAAIPPGEVTRLLVDARFGNESAVSKLFGLVYQELHILARQRLRIGGDQLELDPPSLVHEAYLRLARQEALPGHNRRMFFAYASSVMRAVVVDTLRERAAAKRGGDAVHVTLTMGASAEPLPTSELESLEPALDALERADPRAHRVVVMRYFGGLSVEEVALELQVSAPTIHRDWRRARAFLHHELKAGDA